MKMLNPLEILNPLIKTEAIIYGAGLNCHYALALLQTKYRDVKVLCIADKDERKWGEMSGIPVISPEKLAGYDKNIPVIISPDTNGVSIHKMLSDLGFSSILFYSNYARQLTEAVTEWKKPELKDGGAEKIEFVRLNLADEHSLGVFNAKLDSLYKNQNDELKKLVSLPQYFVPDIIHFGSDEIFADCGAYNGMTAVEFALICKNYAHIYSFEPDFLQYRKIINTPAFKNFPGFEVFELGVSDKSGSLTFSTEEFGSSHISESGGVTINVISLDDFFADKISPTFIKMDIEGAEMDALIGAKGIIEKHHPKLAICAYHGNEHIYEIPFWIKSNFPDYKIYMRQHELINETVCYAVCD
jgi:FkbM family methyltransferase